MSSTAMWLLLAVVVVVILFASVLYKRTFTPHELALTGVMAALSFAAYLFFRVPFYGGSSFHLGNTFTALAALLMDGVSGGLAGAIGLALADILAGDPGYAITTFVLKFIIGVVCGLTAHRLCRIDTADPARRLPYVLRVTVSAGSGLLVNVITDPLLGYFRNVYIFGQPSEKVMELYDTASYRPGDYYGVDEEITQLVDFIISPTLMRLGDPENLARLYKDMSRKDWFMALLDVKDYIQTKERALADYEDRAAWAKKMLVNIAKAGYFSSDRSVAEYERDIWKLR